VPRPADHEAQVQWLYDWWERIDTWISQNRPAGAVPAPVVAPLPGEPLPEEPLPEEPLPEEPAEPVGE